MRVPTRSSWIQVERATRMIGRQERTWAATEGRDMMASSLVEDVTLYGADSKNGFV